MKSNWPGGAFIKLQLLLVIFGVMLGDIGHFRGQSRGVSACAWDLDVSASQAFRSGTEMVVSLWARGEQFVGWRATVGAGGALGWGRGWGQVSGVQVPRRGTAVCNQLFDFE